MQGERNNKRWGGGRRVGWWAAVLIRTNVLFSKGKKKQNTGLSPALTNKPEMERKKKKFTQYYLTFTLYPSTALCLFTSPPPLLPLCHWHVHFSSCCSNYLTVRCFDWYMVADLCVYVSLLANYQISRWMSVCATVRAKFHIQHHQQQRVYLG